MAQVTVVRFARLVPAAILDGTVVGVVWECGARRRIVGKGLVVATVFERRPRRKENAVDQLMALSCDVPDVGELPLTDLLRLGDSALGAALRRLRSEADRPEEVLSGFDAAV